MSFSFNHYTDMDHDGDHDLKDSGMFHEMIEEDERNSHSHPSGYQRFVFDSGVFKFIGVLLVIYLIANAIFP